MMKLPWTKRRCTLAITTSLPNSALNWYELLLCWLVLMPMDARFDCTIIHLSSLDWRSALHFFFFMPLTNLWSNYLPFLCIIYYRNKVFIISAYLDSECVTCGALLQNALVELLHTRNQLFLQSSDPSFLTAERITIKKFLWYHWWLMHNRISAAPCTPRMMLFARWIAIYHAFSYYF